MLSEKSLAIVLRTVEFSETSLIVTLFTEDFGKLGAMAKGARRPKSPFESALDLLAVCRIVFLHKSSDALDLLTEARLERRFRAAARDLSRLYAGYYVAELLNDLTDTADPHPELFRAADQALRDLDGDRVVAEVVMRFELTLLRELGHLPSLSLCVGCGKEVDEPGRVAFGQLAGGVLCRQCRIGQRQVVSVSSAAITMLRKMTTGDESDGVDFPKHRAVNEQHDPVAWDPRIAGELRGVLNHYMSHLLGRRPRMLPYLGMLAG